jgi:hypothetical protein
MSKTKPDHYRNAKFDACDVCDDWQLKRWPAAAMKYIQRAGTKPNETYEDDILKAIWYLTRDLTGNKGICDHVVNAIADNVNKVKDQDQSV